MSMQIYTDRRAITLPPDEWRGAIRQALVEAGMAHDLANLTAARVVRALLDRFKDLAREETR